MSPQFKKEYMEKFHLRYKNARTRAQKSDLITELCITCKWHRKHAIRKLSNFKRFTKPKPKKRGKPSKYNKPEIIEILERIWLASYLPCSKNLKVTIPIWIPSYQLEYGSIPKDTIKLLYQISPSTLDRILKPVRIKYTGKGRCTTKPGTLIRNHIPIKTEQWDESRPGFIEADTVAHCGDNIEGMYAHTLDTVDIATSWTEQRATWGKGYSGVMDQIIDIEKSLPFPLLGFDSDNGGEFINWHLYRYFREREDLVEYTRSRAYKKNDNAHIEQKNWTHVRQWFGYVRLDNPKVVPLMNDLYTSEWRLYHNFFCPSMKLKDKKRIASKVIKCYYSPKTPYQRVLESEHVSAKIKNDLKEQFSGLNPFRLRKAIDKKISNILKTNRQK
jgi:5S rRNA maturation endonuclease (ribonuclease M5)